MIWSAQGSELRNLRLDVHFNVNLEAAPGYVLNDEAVPRELVLCTAQCLAGQLD